MFVRYIGTSDKHRLYGSTGAKFLPNVVTYIPKYKFRKLSIGDFEKVGTIIPGLKRDSEPIQIVLPRELRHICPAFALVRHVAQLYPQNPIHITNSALVACFNIEGVVTGKVSSKPYRSFNLIEEKNPTRYHSKPMTTHPLWRRQARLMFKLDEEDIPQWPQYIEENEPNPNGNIVISAWKETVGSCWYELGEALREHDPSAVMVTENTPLPQCVELIRNARKVVSLGTSDLMYLSVYMKRSTLCFTHPTDVNGFGRHLRQLLPFKEAGIWQWGIRGQVRGGDGQALGVDEIARKIIESAV